MQKGEKIRTNAQYVVLLNCLLLSGCAAKHPVAATPAQPPAVVANNTYPKQIPNEGDFVIHGCTVTKEMRDKADCICRHPVTQLAVENPGKTTIRCR